MAVRSFAQSGFTLIEVLVALTILGMLAVVVSAATTGALGAWGRGAAKMKSTNAIALAQLELQENLSIARAPFSGSENNLRWVGGPFSGAEAAGVYAYDLSAGEKGALILRWRLSSDANVGGEKVLIKRGPALLFAYQVAGRAISQTDQMPDAVTIRAEEGAWPAMYIPLAYKEKGA